MTSELLTGLIAANLAACAAVAVAMVLRRPLRRLVGARGAYAIWLIVPVAMLASLAPARQAAQAVAPIRPAAEAAVAWVYTAIPAATVSTRPLFDASLLVWLWLAGAAAFVLMLGFGQLRVIAKFGLLGSDGKGFARAANRDAGPALVGLLRPTIILPTDFETRFDAREQVLILAHERTHLKDGHLWINGLAALIRALNWFNPLVHLGAFYARVDQELACDAAVAARFPGERRTYAEAMLKTQLATAPLPLGCYWPGGSSTLLQERLQMLANKTPNLTHRLTGGAAIVALLAGAGFTAWAAQPLQEVAAPAVAAQAAPATTQAGSGATATAPAPRATVAFTNAGGTLNVGSGSLQDAIRAGNLLDVVDRGGTSADIAAVVKSQFAGRSLEPGEVEGMARMVDLSDGGSFVPANPGPNGQRAISRLDAEGKPTARLFLEPDGQVGGVAAVMTRPPAPRAVPPAGTTEFRAVPISAEGGRPPAPVAVPPAGSAGF